jgi:signal transduction histidine kinase
MRSFLSFFFNKIVNPRSQGDDSRRREFILNVILVGSIVLAVIANLSLFFNVYTQGSAYRGSSFFVHAFILFVFVGLYALSRAGFPRAASLIMMGLYFVPVTYTLYRWGVDVPQGLLTYVLIIVISGILLGTSFAFFATATISLTLLALGYMQNAFITRPDLSWKSEMLHMNDVLVAVITLAVVSVVSWLSNREIEKSLRRARRSEAELKLERDSLEVKVEERTRELRRTQMERMTQLSHFAEFGKLSSGLLHELANPLTALSLNLERLKDRYAEEVAGMKSHVEQALDAAKRMEDFVRAARKQIQQQETMADFSPAEEIRQVIQILGYRAKQEGVEVGFKGGSRIVAYGNFLKFSQVMSNLVANAIDAYAGEAGKSRTKEVEVRLRQKDDTVFITVRDFGIGIAEENLKKIFDPFFTTKGAEKGTGIGLSMSREIVEKDFGGRISVASAEGRWTLFTVEIPIKAPGNNK